MILTKFQLDIHSDMRIYTNQSSAGYLYPNRSNSMQNETQIFKALSDPTRLRILILLLNNGELCVCDLIESLLIPQSTASRHLAQLRSSRLVDGERRGTWMYYRITEDSGLGSAILAALKVHSSGIESVIKDQKRCDAFLATKDGPPAPTNKKYKGL